MNHDEELEHLLDGLTADLERERAEEQRLERALDAGLDLSGLTEPDQTNSK